MKIIRFSAPASSVHNSPIAPGRKSGAISIATLPIPMQIKKKHVLNMLYLTLIKNETRKNSILLTETDDEDGDMKRQVHKNKKYKSIATKVKAARFYIVY